MLNVGLKIASEIAINRSRYTWVPEDEESTRLEGPRPVLPPTLSAPIPVNPRPAPQQPPRPKHVSFARSHTLTSFEVPRSRSPPRSHERLIDSQPTMQGSVSAVLPLSHAYVNSGDPRILVLGKSRGSMAFVSGSMYVVKKKLWITIVYSLCLFFYLFIKFFFFTIVFLSLSTVFH